MDLLGFNKSQLDEKLNTLSLNEEEHNSIEPELAAFDDQTNENVFDLISQNTEQKEQQQQAKPTSPINFSFENGNKKFLHEFTNKQNLIKYSYKI